MKSSAHMLYSEDTIVRPTVITRDFNSHLSISKQYLHSMLVLISMQKQQSLGALPKASHPEIVIDHFIV